MQYDSSDPVLGYTLKMYIWNVLDLMLSWGYFYLIYQLQTIFLFVLQLQVCWTKQLKFCIADFIEILGSFILYAKWRSWRLSN